MHATVVGAAATSPAGASIANVWYSMMINLQKKSERKLEILGPNVKTCGTFSQILWSSQNDSTLL